MKKIVIMLLVGLISTATYAQEKTAEELVASKQKADMTWVQIL